MTVLAGTFLVILYRSNLQTAKTEVENLNRKLATVRSQVDHYRGNPSIAVVYGDPPIPQHPDHPPGLAQTYYRGNCERNAALFNNGNYRTAELRVSLRDGSGQLIETKSNVNSKQLIIRFELNRSPSTADALFSEGLMRNVFLTTGVYDRLPKKRTADIVRLSVVRPDWQWKADIPIGSMSTSSTLDGLIYVYKGRIDDDIVRGTVHYGIRYDLATVAGQLATESDVWLGNLWLNRGIAIPQPDKIPLSEWFDHRPIPEIAGTNSTDPRLLGITEHIGPKREATDSASTTEERGQELQDPDATAPTPTEP